MTWLTVRVFLRPEPPSQTPLFSRPIVRSLTGIFLLAVAFWLLAGFDDQGTVSRELVTETAVTGRPSLTGNFLYWPYYFLVWLLTPFSGGWLAAARLTSAVWGWLAVVSLMVILRRWSNSSLAIGGGVLLASNSWFLNLAKVGSPEIMLVAVPLISGAVMIRFWDRWHRVRAWLSLVGVFLLGWFLPVWPWFILALLLWRLSRPIPNWRLRLGLAGALLALAAGSLWALTQNLGLIHDWSGVPAPPPSLVDWLANLGRVGQSLVWQAPLQPDYWLAGLPLVDILGVVLLTFGAGALWRAANRRLRLLSLAGLGGWAALVALSGGSASPGFFLGLGAVFIVTGVGLVELWAIWQRVFPINPIARLLGFSVLLSLVGLSAFYQGYKYWVVQPRYQPDPAVIFEPDASELIPDNQEEPLP